MQGSRHLSARRLAVLISRALAGAVLGALLAVVWALCFLSRTYEADAALVFPMAGAGLPNGAGGLIGAMMAGRDVPAGGEFPLNTYASVLTSRRALLAAGEAMNVRELYDLDQDEHIINFVRKAVSVDVDPNQMLRIRSRLPGTPSVIQYSDLTDRPAAIARDEPYRLATALLIGELIKQMESIADEIKLDRAKATVVSLRDQLAAAQDELAETEARWQALQERVGNVNPAAAAELTAQALQTRRTALSTTEAELARALQQREQRRRQVQQLADNVESLPSELPFMGELRSAVLEAQLAYDAAARVYGPESAEVLRTRAELADARRELDEAVARARQGLTPDLLELDTQVQGLTAQRASLVQDIASLTTRAEALPDELASVESLQAALIRQGEAVGSLQAQLLAAEMSYEQHGVRWKVLDAPRPPLYRSGPSTLRALLAGGFLGGLLFGLPLLMLGFHRLFNAPSDEAVEEPGVRPLTPLTPAPGDTPEAPTGSDGSG